MKAYLNAAEVAKALGTDRATVIRWIEKGQITTATRPPGKRQWRIPWRPCRRYSNTMKVVSFTIFKGGTGKTTSSVNTAVALVRRGKRVLLVDLDQQASATRYLGIDPESSPSLYQVFMGSRSAANCLRKTGVGVDMLTANTFLAAIEEALEPGDEMKLAGMLRPLKADYDFILLDSPPGKARLTFSGLAARWCPGRPMVRARRLVRSVRYSPRRYASGGRPGRGTFTTAWPPERTPDSSAK